MVQGGKHTQFGSCLASTAINSRFLNDVAVLAVACGESPHSCRPPTVRESGATAPWRTFAGGAHALRPSHHNLLQAMDNQQFRRLLLSNTAQRGQDGDKTKSPVAGTPKSVLGARKHSSIPMTP